MSYSLDLRKKVMKYIDNRGSITSASSFFSIGQSTVRRWIELRKENNNLCKRPHGGGYPAKINISLLREYITSNPDKTLEEIGKEFSVTHNAIWKALRKENYVYKKNSSV